MRWILGILALCAIAAAQTDAPPPIQIGSVTFSGTIHERYEAWDFFAPKSGQNAYGYSGTLITFGFSQQRSGYDWDVEFAAPILLGIPQNAVQAAPQGQLGLGGAYYAANHASNAAMIFPKQAYFGEARPLDEALAIIKRDGISQHLIGIFGFQKAHFKTASRELGGKGIWPHVALLPTDLHSLLRTVPHFRLSKL